MRRAEVERAWEAVAAPKGFGIRHISSAELPPLRSLDLDTPAGLIVVCGLNGVGKTTLLRLVEATMAGVESMAGRCREELLVPGSFELLLEVDGQEERLVLANGEGRPEQVRLLDPFSLCARALEVSRQPNFEDLFQGVESSPASPSEHDDANYVVGAIYESLEYYELEDPGGDGESSLVFPEVGRGGRRYRFHQMGTGELAALLLLWHLRHAPAGTVLLIEEPESFLSAQGSRALMNVVASQTSARRIYAVITTHSSSVVGAVPIEHVRLLHESGGMAVLRAPSSHAELDWLLGDGGSGARVVLVEDKLAGIFVAELLGRYRGLWGQTVDVLGVAGEGNVFTLCQLLPRSSVFHLCGVVDGDQRGKVSSFKGSRSIIALPGESDPGHMCRSAACANPAVFSDRLGRPLEAVESAISRLTAVDSHDWFGEMANALSLMETIILRAAIEAWLEDDANAQAALDVVKAIEGALVE